MSLTRRRVGRILRTGSPRALVRAATRARWLRAETATLELALRSGRPLVVGPFLGELGYELLHWRPYVLRLLRAHGVDRERVTLVGRGGSGAWYEDVAAKTVDAFDLLRPSEILERVEARVAGTGERKQVTVDALDLDLLRLADPSGRAAPVHPLHMFWGNRFAWEGLVPVAEAAAAGDRDPLPRGELPAVVAERLPERYVVLKAYFNECVPDTAGTREAYGRLLAALTEELPVVALQPGFAADDHEEWSAPGVIRIDDLFEPSSNLAVQAAVVARAERLVSTYGGFSYLGPLLGVPTTAVGAIGAENRRHEELLRAAWPSTPYTRVTLVADVAVRAEAVRASP